MNSTTTHTRSASKTTALVAGVAAGAALALWNREAAKRAERATPPVGRFLDLDGTRLHYLRAGSGAPVVLIHGNGALIQDWQVSGVFGRLAASHEVIAFDRPGFGYSERPRTTIWTPAAQARLLVAAMRRLGIERATIVGHSFGALVAAQIGLDYPDAVERLVLLAGYYYPTARADVVLSSGPAVPVVGDVMRYTVSPLLGRAMMPMAERKLFEPAIVPVRFQNGFPRDLALRPSHIRAIAADSAVMIPGAAELAARYPRLSMPVAIVTGDGDQIVTPEDHSMRLHGDVPASRLEVVQGAGHMVHHTAPERVTDAILG
jgi:pimeloyl-ACP methyl ester carboxylesterase